LEKKKDKPNAGNAKYVIGVVILALLVAAIYYFVPNENNGVVPVSTTGTQGNNNSGGASALDAFAKCLTANGVKMYGASWCPHCQNQKTLFGSSWQYVDYVECGNGEQVCVDAGIEGYPTWIISGNKYPGEQSFDELSKLSGCKI